jgi:uncharacterized protein (DUF1697 family)
MDFDMTQKYISFLRGVNMTGHNSIKMTDLTALYVKLGFKDAKTYIQSGNVVFGYDADLTVTELSLTIEKTILDKFNYNIPVMTRSVDQLQDLFSVNPFLEEKEFNPAKMAVIFLHEKPSKDQILKIAGVDYPPDKFKIIGSDIHIFCPNGFGKTKIYTNFFEKRMGVIGTARNWKTITTLLDIARNLT